MGVRRFNFVNVTIYLLLAAGIFGSIKYVPIVWKKNNLETMVKDKSYLAKRTSPERLRQSIVNTAQNELNILLDPEDIEIDRLHDRVRIHVIWRPIIEIPFMEPYVHTIQIDQETQFF